MLHATECVGYFLFMSHTMTDTMYFGRVKCVVWLFNITSLSHLKRATHLPIHRRKCVHRNRTGSHLRVWTHLPCCCCAVRRPKIGGTLGSPRLLETTRYPSFGDPQTDCSDGIRRSNRPWSRGCCYCGNRRCC